ncbi:restriction endonuclease subunit S [Candidatus Nanosynbacter sp. HMT-352]|jgi:Restriction endonuclease S subunits|uniref:restriction endonuclease subunit S n=1 Tax=Candidatus Nanosynbacter sp. HMT-352 TaxID=2899133 RepID=UPI001E37003A|nr:restriction endonuclease subunit S [Candidatus Nanosynbacter sp. HMT-352]UHA57649.1 restriction endonuclease subunit S [Candidatus Nanosynbacter sp. HMT-352]
MKISEVIKSLSASNAAIKNTASSEPKEGWYPAYSASGQDVWLPDCRFTQKGIVVSAVGARCGKAFKADGKWNICANTHPLSVDETKALRDYCWYMINNEDWWIKGGTAQPFVKVKDSFNRDFNFPPISEQKMIVSRLDTIQALINQKQLQIKRLDELVKARFVEMFGDKDETKISDYIDSLEAGKSLAGTEKCENKVLKTGAVSYDYFDVSQTKYLPKDYRPVDAHKINPGNIVISRMNTIELVGAAAYVWNVPDKIYLPDRLWKAKIKNDANPIFVWQTIIHPKTKELIRRIAGGTSGSMKNISKSKFLEMPVKKATREEQGQFAIFVTQIDKSKFVLSNELTMCDFHIRLIHDRVMHSCINLRVAQ